MSLPRRLSAAAPLFASAALALTAIAAAPGPAGAQAAAAPPAGCTGPASPYWLNVVADGLRSSNGLLAVTLYADDSSRFLAKKGSLYVGRLDAKAGTTRACIFVPKPGVYALALYHDENADKKFDRNGLGLPAEGFGFSNNPATLAGLPTFTSVRLNVSKPGLTTRVHMKYP
jgi:uncharacterized protein (DUF2141 family)